MVNNKNKFRCFALSEEIIESLDILEMVNPTEIQKQVIPHILEGKSVIAKSQTGSGKTAAFGIPLCEGINWDERLPQVLVLEPTRELTVQVKQELFFIGRAKRIKVADIFGGFPIDKQIQTLKQRTHIVVGTPGRTLDHLRRESLKLEKVKHLVIDEADLMLDMGFYQEVKEIIERLPKEVGIYLFSATMNEKVKELTNEMDCEAVQIELESDLHIGDSIQQKLYKVEQEQKYEVFVRLLMKENPDKAMIFCGTREMVEVLGRKLQREGIRCGILHGEIEQRARIRAIEGFKKSQFRFLITTDISARGVDVDSLSHVINYDFPTGRETYVHRIGRTGRNGAKGSAVSLITVEDEKMLGMVEEHMQLKLPILSEPTIEDCEKNIFYKKQKTVTKRKKTKEEKFGNSVTKLTIGGGKKSKMRAVDIVGAISNIPTINSDDIGIIDVRDSFTNIEILNGKGDIVYDALKTHTIKGKLRKVKRFGGYKGVK